MKEVYIVSAVRTPIGSFLGTFSDISATKLGSIAIEGALNKVNLKTSHIDEVLMGNVISAGLGQAPAKQSALDAGISNQTPCTTINKVCSSGMKAITLGAQSIMLGINECVMVGGFENMSNVPYYLSNARNGYKLGNGKIIDGLLHDGLWEPYHNFAMGNCADNTAKKMRISRDQQDEYAIKSYQRSQKAWENGLFNNEVIPVKVNNKKNVFTTVKEDEEYKKVNFDKIRNLKSVFDVNGTVTAANASTINDGAAALVLMSKEKIDKLGIKPIAKISGFADASQEPIWFTTAPSLAIPKALSNAKINISDVDFFEINEAFSVVALANIKELNLDTEKVNIHGGAVALGHPLGTSGARIVVTLLGVLQQNNGKIGVAGICNGGGGATAIVIENIS